MCVICNFQILIRGYKNIIKKVWTINNFFKKAKWEFKNKINLVLKLKKKKKENMEFQEAGLQV